MSDMTQLILDKVMVNIDKTSTLIEKVSNINDKVESLDIKMITLSDENKGHQARWLKDKEDIYKKLDPIYTDYEIWKKNRSSIGIINTQNAWKLVLTIITIIGTILTGLLITSPSDLKSSGDIGNDLTKNINK